MRTTVTLDPDVERLLKDQARRSRLSIKQVLNAAIRQRRAVLAAVDPFQHRRQVTFRSGIDRGGVLHRCCAIEVRTGRLIDIDQVRGILLPLAGSPPGTDGGEELERDKERRAGHASPAVGLTAVQRGAEQRVIVAADQIE